MAGTGSRDAGTRPFLRAPEERTWVWVAIIVMLLIALATSLIAYLHAASVARCVNTSLAARDALTGQLHAADVKRVQGQKDAEKVKTDGLNQIAHATSQAEGVAGFHRYIDGERQFTKTLDDYIAESNRIRAAQLRHPLGQC